MKKVQVATATVCGYTKVSIYVEEGELKRICIVDFWREVFDSLKFLTVEIKNIDTMTQETLSTYADLVRNDAGDITEIVFTATKIMPEIEKREIKRAEYERIEKENEARKLMKSYEELREQYRKIKEEHQILQEKWDLLPHPEIERMMTKKKQERAEKDKKEYQKKIEWLKKNTTETRENTKEYRYDTQHYSDLRKFGIEKEIAEYVIDSFDDVYVRYSNYEEEAERVVVIDFAGKEYILN